MSNVRSLRCISCSAAYQSMPDTYVCPVCGGIFDIEYDYGAIDGGEFVRGLAETAAARVAQVAPAPGAAPAAPAAPIAPIWRYAALLPVEVSERAGLPRLAAGGTPLYRNTRLGDVLGLAEVMVKDDGLNPTGSLKDRASAVAVAAALQSGASTISCASTGNAASSCAGCAASSGLRSVIFVPRRAPQAKLVQLLAFGAVVVRVQADYADAFTLSAKAIKAHGWYNRNAAINPVMIEGKKTVSFEIAEALGWLVPDWVAVSVGDGCTVAGVAKGFWELERIGVIRRRPKILGVQAVGANAISRAFREDADHGQVRPGGTDTFADSIAVAVPRNPHKAVRGVRRSGGTMIDVSDDQIGRAMLLMGRSCGVFAEPAAAASLAGLAAAVEAGIVAPHETACVIVTGNGLKDVASGAKVAGEPIDVSPDLGELERRLAEVAPEVMR